MMHDILTDLNTLDPTILCAIFLSYNFLTRKLDKELSFMRFPPTRGSIPLN